MMPSVPLPAGIRKPIDFKAEAEVALRQEAARVRVAVGKTFKPHAALPKKSRIVHKAPGLVDADEARLSKTRRTCGATCR